MTNRYSTQFIILVAIHIMALIVANIIAFKPVMLGHGQFIVSAGTIVFPVTYIAGDILTEVYGIKTARFVIVLGFVVNLLAVGVFIIAGALPAANGWPFQSVYDTVFNYTPRLLVASFAAYLVGEFANSWVLDWLKRATNGRWLWVRTIGSTFVGQGLDSLIFSVIAFAGVVGFDLPNVVITTWLLKTGYEAFCTPFTYVVIAYFERYREVL